MYVAVASPYPVGWGVTLVKHEHFIQENLSDFALVVNLLNLNEHINIMRIMSKAMIIKLC